MWLGGRWEVSVVASKGVVCVGGRVQGLVGAWCR